MSQTTVRYLVAGTVCTDVILGDLASIQPITDALRVKLTKPGVVIRDWSPTPAPVMTVFYKDAAVCYFGPEEEKYLDVA